MSADEFKDTRSIHEMPPEACSTEWCDQVVPFGMGRFCDDCRMLGYARNPFYSPRARGHPQALARDIVRRARFGVTECMSDVWIHGTHLVHRGVRIPYRSALLYLYEDWPGGKIVQLNADRRSAVDFEVSTRRVRTAVCVCADVGCCNPHHLRWRDDLVRARAAASNRNRPTPYIGVRHHSAKLSDSDIRAIRRIVREGEGEGGAPLMTQSELAHAYDVSTAHICNIVSGKARFSAGGFGDDRDDYLTPGDMRRGVKRGER